MVQKIITNNKPNTNKVYLTQRNIEEVDSSRHVILQFVDIIVGLVDFILNTSTSEIKNSKRAMARYNIWKQLEKYIFEIDDNFIISETTRPVYSFKGWVKKYAHFVYQKKSPNTST